MKLSEMEVRVMSWNMAGAKLLDKLSPKGNKAAEYVAAYKKVWINSIQRHIEATKGNKLGSQPDLILLQETCNASLMRRFDGPRSAPPMV